MRITQKLITTNFKLGRRKRDEFPKAGVYKIIFHTYAGAGTSLYNWFMSSANVSKASAHYSVWKNGTIEQYVLDENTAFDNTHKWYQDIGISIEHQDDGNPNDSIRTPKLYESSSQLVAHLCLKHGIDIYADGWWVLHRDIQSNRSCPGGLDIPRIIKRAREIYAETVTPEWKRNAKDIDNYFAITKQDDTKLYDFVTGKVIATYSKGQEVEVDVETVIDGQKWLMTNYSWVNGMPRGFKAEDLELKQHEPEPPIIIEPEPPIEPELPIEPEAPVKPTQPNITSLIFNLIKKVLEFISNIKK